MHNDALYYPHIALKNPTWVKAMALFYDNIYRIVPDDVIPEDNCELQALLEEGSVGRMIDPAPYSQTASDEFLSKLDDWCAAALAGDPEGEQQITRLHSDKTDQRVQRLFRESGFQNHDSWMHIPTELASNYMLYLSTEIAKKNNLSLITGDWGAWTGTSFFNLNGQIDETITPEMQADYVDDPFGLFCLIVGEITPLNIDEIRSEEILEFRLKRKDEIANFRKCLVALHAQLQTVDSDEIKIDLIEAKTKDFQRAKVDYQKSADLINAKGWFGVTMMGFPAPIVFGKLMSIPTTSTVALGVTGLALGALYSIKNTENELRRLRQENPISCIVEMKESFKNYTSMRGGGDINYHAWNCMEEFVND